MELVDNENIDGEEGDIVNHTMSYAMSCAMLYARTYDVQAKHHMIQYRIRCDIRYRMFDIRYRMHVRHHMLQCHMCQTYDIDIQLRTCTTYYVVMV